MLNLWADQPPIVSPPLPRRIGAAAAALPLYRIEALPDSGKYTPVSAEDINQQGWVTGVAYVHADEWAAYVYVDGQTRMLPGGRLAYAHSLNDRGDVVGTLDGQACWWPLGGERQMLAGLRQAASVNDRGQIAGSACFDGVNERAALFSAGELIDLGTLGGATSVATGVNDAGQVTGYSQLASGEVHAFVWQPVSGLLDLGTLGGAESRAAAINARGLVLGCSDDGDCQSLPFVRIGSEMAVLPSVGEMDLAAFSLNRHGEAVGKLTAANGQWIASLTRGGRTRRLLNLLDASGAEWKSLSVALGINDASQIVGVGQRQHEQTERAFIATPLPR